MAKLVRPGVKLAVRQLLGFKHDRNRIRRSFNLLLEQLVKTPVSRRGCLVIDPVEPHSLLISWKSSRFVSSTPDDASGISAGVTLARRAFNPSASRAVSKTC